MGNFDRRGKRSGGGFSRGFGDRKSFGGRDSGRPVMHDAICSDCGNDCQVPFRPTGSKPVLCNSCFGGKESRGGRPERFGNSRGYGDRQDKPRFRDKQMHDAVCDKCGKDCQVPFRPTGDKPIFCDNCFGKNEKTSKGGSDVSMDQIKELNKKIDKLIEILTPNAPVKKAKETKTETKEVKAEKKEKTKTKTASKKVSTKKKK